MKIYRGEVGVSLSVDSFMKLLEHGMVFDTIGVILNMDSMDSMFDIGWGKLSDDQISEIDDFLDMMDGVEPGQSIEEVDPEAFRDEFGIGIEDITGGGNVMDTEQSAEDVRVKRIVRRCGHIDNAS